MSEYLYVKEDIAEFVDMLGYTNQEDLELLRFISKKIIFLKDIKSVIPEIDDSVSFYINQIISDLIYLIESYQKNELRYTYLNMRSLIEGFARLFSLVESGTNKVSMTLLLENINEYINLNDLVDSNGKKLEYSRLKSLYKECCLYVHGNIKANFSLLEYYKEIQNKSITLQQKRKLNSDIKFLINVLITIACYRFSSPLNDIFFRGKLKLEFLIGKENVSLIKNHLNFNISYTFQDPDLGQTTIKEIILTRKKGNEITDISYEFKEYTVISCSIPETTLFVDENQKIICTLEKIAETQHTCGTCSI